MKRNLITLTLGAAIAVMCGNTTQAQYPCDLNDMNGANAYPGVIGAYDVYMVDVSAPSAGAPVQNDYSNGNGWNNNIGQIFTTPAAAPGYSVFALNTVAILTGGNGGRNINSTPQSWALNLYTITYPGGTATATPLTSYSCTNGFTFTELDWIQFTNLGVGLLPSTTYAYTIENLGAGWEAIDGETGFADSSGNANDMTADITLGVGAAPVQTMASGWNEDFEVGLTPANLVVNPPSIATTGNVYPVALFGNVLAYTNGSSIEIDSGAVLGSGSFTYQWQTDNGTGGSMVNIGGPAGTSQNYIFTASSIGVFKFDVVVNNGSINITSRPVSLTIAYPNQAATLTDSGANPVLSPCYPSIQQLQAGGDGDALNYFDNNFSAPPGQTFTTGGNAGGYTLSTIQIESGGSAAPGWGGLYGSITTPQTYYLYIYSYNPATATATILQAYTNANFSIANFGDWFEWGNLNVQLQPNKMYAYTFANNSVGWMLLNSSTNNLWPTPITNNIYAGGLACLISPANGSVELADSGDSGTFVVGLEANPVEPTCPVAAGIIPSLLGGIPLGTPLTLTENAQGAPTLHYTWQTDGGTGGTLTNIPSSDVSVLAVSENSAGGYRYDVIVSNTYGTSTSGVTTVTYVVPVQAGVLTDIGTNAPTPGTYDIAQLVTPATHGSPPGWNYYFNNSPPPGETFTTGNNAAGYNLNYIDIALADDSGSWTSSGGPLPTNGQPYLLTIYSVNTATTNATAIAMYESQTNFVIITGVTDSDWLNFSGLSVPLAPNSVYAYSFIQDSSENDWGNLANVSGGLYAGGQAALLPTIAGTYQTAAGYNASFDVGLSLGSVTLNYTVLPDGDVQLCWSLGTLVYTTSLVPPITWTTVPGATSCWTVTPSGPEKFYAVKVQ
jgi:hypothetical protein